MNAAPAQAASKIASPFAKRATNLNLTASRLKPATQAAKERYGISLSTLVDRLLERELSLKGGLLKARIATRS